jgi:P-type E1-E2 ATPase
MGVIFFEDKLRPDAIGLIQNLKNLGVKAIIMLTGDREENAKRIAAEIGITHYHANLHPEGKVNEILDIAKQHPYTLMVGDGINDAPALASAYVGLAMGAKGVAISAQAADIVLLEDKIERVATAIAIGQRMLLIAKQGIWIGMGLSVLLMVIAAFGYIPPPIGAVLQEIIDVTVILNALRARR